MPEKDNVVAKSAEYSGRTEEEAVAAAALDLGISVSELRYSVVRDTSHSFLGLVRTGEITIAVELPVESVSELPQDEADDALEPDDELPVAEYQGEAPADEMVDEGLEEEGLDESASELEEIATEVLATLLDKMGFFAAVEVMSLPEDEMSEEAPLRLNIVGDDVTSLIGRRGETLRDLQFVTRLIISRQFGEWPNIVVDVEGYKEHRASSLRSLALRMAEQVRRTGEPVVLEPMPSYERRIVHLALRDAEGVYTESTGQDESRKVQILPR